MKLFYGVSESVFILIVIFSLFTAGRTQEEDGIEKIKFWFYPNALDINERQEFQVQDLLTITNSNFNRNKPVKVLIHGATANCTENPFPFSLIEAYLKDKVAREADYNVICVDWGPLAAPTAVKRGQSVEESIARNTVLTGQKTATLLKILRDNALIANYKDVHVIGHSLGAHTAGVTGLSIRQSHNFTEIIGRISGIDPAGLIYRSRPINLDEQLDLSDGTFVDITHTNDKQIGLEGKYGHADFYPDGGEHQKDCYRRGIATAIVETAVGGCSHIIGPEYWVTSILHKNITACKANSYSEFQRNSQCTGEDAPNFGDNAPSNIFGKFYFDP